jgi:hypothetical protein
VGSVIAQKKTDDALLQAVRTENVEAMRALIERGANVNAKDIGGNTPLHSAAENWAVECLKVLLSSGADINARNNLGETPLMVAGNIPKALGILLDAGADMNARDKRGSTALLNAASSGEISKVKMLIQRGADVSLRSPEGKTALDIAIESNHKKIAALLRGDIRPEIKCPTLETYESLVKATLSDSDGRVTNAVFEAVFVAVAGNSDDTISGNLALSLSDKERHHVALWVKKELSDIPATVNIQDVYGSFVKNTECPNLEIGFSEVSTPERSFLIGVGVRSDRFKLKLKIDEGELSKIVCVWARQSYSPRPRGSGVIAAFNRAINCAEFDRWN